MMEFFKKAKKEPKDLKEILAGFNELEGKFSKVLGEMKKLENKQKFSVQKLGIVRFNPFSEVGSDQSFSMALLNDENDGVVITSLYTRQENRVYGKPIKDSQSEYSLSEEEKKAIEKAKNSKNNE
ncbi:MAG: DUF4446 family protein [Candidatus Nealsonbacteria bacterium]|nr:DUF4446 family protein [Candidatus Nealsonbacteria bacterium]